MKTRQINPRWNTVWILNVVCVISMAPLARADNAGQKAVDETRGTLRQQGFKTDLADFDFSTSPELRAREAILNATDPYRHYSPVVILQSLMEGVGTNSAIVVWKLNSVKGKFPWPDKREELTWDDFRKAINTNQARLDDACAAILAGPIRLNVKVTPLGTMVPLSRLALLKYFPGTFGNRTVLALHDGDLDAAWTNLMAATRLVTAWEPEPSDDSHLLRFQNTALAFNAIWQALQTDGWPDDKLSRLQTEWESVNFFTNLPGTAAFKRARYVTLCQLERQGLLDPRPSLAVFVVGAFQMPRWIWDELNRRWEQTNYSKRGAWEDEKALLLFYRDREVELRQAIQAPTWLAMRQLPGVTNILSFQSEHRSLMHLKMEIHEFTIHEELRNEGSTLLGRAAMAEAQRRLVITAIALERYRGKNGSYPSALTELTPEFLKNPLKDFVNGQPLHYHSTDDGHFILYSVGVDGVDYGGQMPLRQWLGPPGEFSPGTFSARSKADIVWPIPASTAAVEALRAEEARAAMAKPRGNHGGANRRESSARAR